MPNCTWVGPPWLLAEGCGPPEEKLAEKKRPPAGTGAGGGARGIWAGSGEVSAGRCGTLSRSQPAAFAMPFATLSATPLATLPTHPARPAACAGTEPSSVAIAFWNPLAACSAT
jgi:hypothetical protein